MILDYIDEINAFGENMIRLHDFDKAQAEKLRQAIHKTVVIQRKSLDLSKLDFIQTRNCTLTFRISDEDEGIGTNDKTNFYCNLTVKGYEKMLVLLLPFCAKETKGHQFLYDIDTETDFLFSPEGTW